MSNSVKKSKTSKKLVITLIAGILGIILGVCIFVFRDDISDFIFKHTATVENIKTNVSDDIVSPLGNDTVLDLSREGDFLLHNGKNIESFTYGGKTIKLRQFTQRKDITVEEIAAYLADISTVSDLDTSTLDIELDNITNIDASKFEEMINDYIKNDMDANNNRFTIKFANGDEIEVPSHTHTTDVEHSDNAGGTVRVKPNILEVNVRFSPINDEGEEPWTKDNTYISYVGLNLSNKGQGQRSPYGINGEPIVNTYINYKGNKSILIWKIGFTIGA